MLAISRETGLGFLGPWIIGHLARVSPDHSRSRRYLVEGEGLIAKGYVGHNYWGFYRDAVDLSLRDRTWSEAERYAAALEDLRRCGHPNSLKIGENRVSAHIEKLILNVFSGFPA